MKSPLAHRGSGAFTLVEMLTVIAIIGILAALLLPALEGGKARAKLVGCQNNLGQLGLAFHSFSHEHASKFPMQVSVAQGGTLELVQNGYLINGEFYFAYRNFQSLADDLVTPNILICPTDTRLPATNFISVRNKNLSYFIGVNADYNQTESILAGDRNLRVGAGQSIYSGAGQLLRWSETMHRIKGNLLFADGHVEESKGFSLAGRPGSTNGPGVPGGGGGSVAKSDFFIPSVKAEGASAQPALTGQENSNQVGAASNRGGGPENSTSSNPPVQPKPPALNGQSGAGNNFAAASPVTSQSVNSPPTNRTTVVVQISTNLTAATDDDSGMSFFDRRLAKVFRTVFGVGYSLLLLVFLSWLGFKLRREWRERQRKR